MSGSEKVRREVLPIPDASHVDLTTYDAKDPDTKHPPIRDIRPPKGAPDVPIVLIEDVGGKEAQDADHFLTAEERFHIAMARQ